MNCRSDRDMMLRRLQAADFAIIEANLYLDTHPTCPNGLEYFRRARAERDAVLREFEAAYGPVTMDNAAAECYWDWVNAPWPWELEA